MLQDNKNLNLLRKLMRRLLKVLTMALLLSATAACQKQENKKNVRYLNISFPEEPTTFDPRKGADAVASSLHFMLFEGLTKNSRKSSSDFGIAKEILLSKDKKTYTFKLRDSKWSNGEPLTAYDFEYSFLSMLDPSFPSLNINMLYKVKNAEDAKKGLIGLDQVGIKALDEKTLQIQLEHPVPFFLDILSFCVFNPVPHKVVKKHSNWADRLSSNYLSNGPFRLISWKTEHEFILEKNPYYWDADNVKLDGIHVSIIHDENTALEMFKNKEIDIIGSPYAEVPQDALESLNSSNLIQAYPVAKTIFCSFNNKMKPFSNKWIRKALSLAIDRDAIVSEVTCLKETPAYNFVPPALKSGINKKFFQPFNTTLANIYLEKGLEELDMTRKDFSKYTLAYLPGITFSRLVQFIHADWKKYLNIDFQLKLYNRKAFLTMAKDGDYDLCIYYWLAMYFDPMNILDRFKRSSNPKNPAKWENDEYASLLDLSYGETGEQRINTLEKAEKIFLEDMPIAPIYHLNAISAVQPYVKGLHNAPIGSIHFNEVEIKEDTK